MGAVTGAGEVPEWWSERNNRQAEKLLMQFQQSSSKPLVHMGVPSFPHISGDHPIPQGMFVGLLFAPFVWPVDSESQLANEADVLGREEQFHEQQGNETYRLAQQVLNDHWTAGEGAEAAEAAYRAAAAARFKQADIAGVAKKLVARVSSDVERTKRWMLRENKAAHQEAEAFLRSGSGRSIAQIAAIISQHRTMIQTYSADLHANVANDTLLFTNQFPLSPEGGHEPKIRQAGNGTGSDTWTDPESHSPPGSPGPKHPPTPQGSGRNADAWSDSPTGIPGSGGIPASSGPSSPHWSDPSPRPTPSPLSSLGGGGLPGLPSMPSGGGGVPGFPMSMLGGLGKFPGATGLPSTAGFPSSVSSPPALSSFGADFGRGLAAGASAVGAVPAAAPPSAPLAPLMASPVESTVTAAAPAAASVAAPMSSAAPAAGVPGMAAGSLAPYGSVLPPAMSSAVPAGVGAPAGLSAPAEGGVSSAGAANAAGLMPVGGRRGAAAVHRDSAETDLELARIAVADLAGAACVTDPGLDWAVAVGRNQSTGAVSLWVATNDGATYIPPGVFVRKTMPIAAVFNEEFDARWFGWVNPAEKAVRAARALGDEVSAVATTWAWPSEYLTDRPAVREIATGVPPSGLDSPASELLASRSHRLHTVDAALYASVKAADESVLRDYCRELVRRLVFGGDGDELSPVAQSVARALVARQWPRVEEWAALGAEYDTAVILAGAQRPGLDGLENPDQMVSYARHFVNCRRLEALLCWERYGGDLANAVYAAWVCGVRLLLSDFVLC
jgi:hypothetical protein